MKHEDGVEITRTNAMSVRMVFIKKRKKKHTINLFMCSEDRTEAGFFAAYYCKYRAEAVGISYDYRGLSMTLRAIYVCARAIALFASQTARFDTRRVHTHM